MWLVLKAYPLNRSSVNLPKKGSSKKLGTVSVKRYSETIRISMSNPCITASKASKPRGKITNFTSQSKQNFGLLLRETKGLWKYESTLTYPADFPCNGLKVRRDRKAFLNQLTRRGYKYTWFYEFQERGAPHIHVYTDKEIEKAWLSSSWFKIVGSGDLKHLAAGTRSEAIRSEGGAIGYALGYALSKKGRKAAQKRLPEGFEDVGRWWGSNVKVKPVGEYTRKYKGESIREIQNERARDLRWLRKCYESKLKSWGVKGWKFRINQGCTMWGMAPAWSRILEYRTEQKNMEVVKNGNER